MIGTIDVEVNAAHPAMPLAEFAAFVGSPSHVRVRNVPRGVGNWQITAVYVAVTYPDNSARAVSCAHVGALWTCTISGCDTPGHISPGYQVLADGLDEEGNAITGYVLGAGDVYILNRDGSITVGETTYYFHLLDAPPSTPKKADVCMVDGTLKWYDGTAWQQFGAAVVPPSTDQSAAGAAADAKATGDALATKRSTTDMRVLGAPYVDVELPVGTFDLDGFAMEYSPASFTWNLDNFEVYAYSAGSYRLTDFTDPQDVKQADFALSAANGYTATVLGHVITGYADALAKESQLPAASSATPAMDGTASAGTSAAFARGDHVHPSDALKQDAIDDLATIRSGAAAGATAVQPAALAGAVRYALSDSATPIASASVELPASAFPIAVEYNGESFTFNSMSGSGYALRLFYADGGYTLDDGNEGIFQICRFNADGTFKQDGGGFTSLTFGDPATQPVANTSPTLTFYGSATLADRTANRVAITAALDELRLTFPVATDDKVCDFGLRVEVGTGSAALDAPALKFIDPVTGLDVTIENPDGEIPALASGTATAKGVTILYFTETAPGVFLVKGEEVKEVA